MCVYKNAITDAQQILLSKRISTMKKDVLQKIVLPGLDYSSFPKRRLLNRFGFYYLLKIYKH